MKTYQLPDYILKSFFRHVSTIIDCVDDKGKSRVADAVRLTRKDLKKIEKIITNKK